MKAWASLAVAVLAIPLASGAAPSAVAPGGPHRACTWQVAATGGPSAATLNAVAATSASNAWAVGSYHTQAGYRTLIERWNGRSWQVIPSPNPDANGFGTDTLGGVVALSKSNAWAFGFYEKRTTSFRTLILHWNGSHWSVVPSPNSGSGENVLGAAAAVSPSDIWAVGYRNGPGPRKTLTEHWNGSSWSIVASPNAGSAKTENYLFGVAAFAHQGWAVGGDTRSYGRTLALRLVGTAWSWVPTVNPGQGDRFLQAVSAPSDGVALAVGSYLTQNRTKTHGERWTSAGWSVVPSASPGGDYNSLQGVAAKSVSNAWAVGTQRATPGSSFRTLIEQWNGTAWTPVASPSPSRGDNWLFGVAAVPGGGFLAVGNAGPRALIERYC